MKKLRIIKRLMNRKIVNIDKINSPINTINVHHPVKNYPVLTLRSAQNLITVFFRALVYGLLVCTHYPHQK